MKSLTGQLLLAARRLADPNFARSVILMVQHGDDGALGLVLNRPLDLTVRQACNEALESPSAADGVLHQGGPCQGPLMALHAHPDAGEVEVLPGLFFSTQRGELESLLKRTDAKVKFFVGYSGWAPGQLEKELETGSWLVTPADQEVVFYDGEQWAQLITQLTLGSKINPDSIPDDPSVN